MKAKLSIRSLELEASGDVIREGIRAIMQPDYKPARPIRVYPKRFTPQMLEQIEVGAKTATRRLVTAGNSIIEPGAFENVDLESGRRKNAGGENIIRARCRFNAGERVVSIRSKIQPLDLLWCRRGQRGGTRASSTLTLEVWAVDVSRLQDMSDEDAIAEGVWHPTAPEGEEDQPIYRDLWLPCAEKDKAHLSPRLPFRDLWESINGRGSWATNPWVWTYRFTVHRMNIDELLEQRRALTRS